MSSVVPLSFLLILTVARAATLPKAPPSLVKVDRLPYSLPHVVRAAQCIVNETHCHCAMTAPDKGQMCLRAVEGETGRCFVAPCVAGFKCDCESNEICRKMSSVSYTATDRSGGIGEEGEQVTCEKGEKMVPRVVTGRTTDFHVLSRGMFSFYRNNEQIGFGDGNDHKQLTMEIGLGDVVGIVAQGINGSAALKVRFRDMQNEVRVIDENWRCSNEFAPDWMQKAFVPEERGWVSPSVVAGENSGYDADVPWMWMGNAALLFCRYVLV